MLSIKIFGRSLCQIINAETICMRSKSHVEAALEWERHQEKRIFKKWWIDEYRWIHSKTAIEVKIKNK